MLSSKERAELTYKALKERKRRREAQKNSDFWGFKEECIRRCSQGKVRMKGRV